MEIKKGDFFKCNIDYMAHFTKGQEYVCFEDGYIRDNDGDIFELKGSSFQNGFEHVSKSQPDKINPSHYKSYDVESIEMAIRIWGKEEVAIFSKISAFCYRMRMGMKDDVSIELGKEKWFLNKWKELKDDVA